MYTIALFAHIVGVLGLFIAIGIEGLALARMRCARSVAHVLEWADATHAVGALHPVAILLILGPGLHMLLSVWGWATAWIDISLALTLTLSVLGPAVSARRFKAIRAAAATAPEGMPPAALTRLIHDRVLGVSFLAMAGVAVGIVYLMTVKPGTVGSLAAVALGALSALPSLGAALAPAEATSAPVTEQGGLFGR